MKPFPAAMPPPGTDLTFITEKMMAEAIALSRKSPRKRIILPFHKEDGNTLHRMFNVVQPGSYIRPHHHKKANKCESIIVLRGSICYLSFSEYGKIQNFQKLTAGSPIFGVDSEPHIIHSFYALEEDTVVFEVKPGPYDPAIDKDFAVWSPEEGTPEAEIYLQSLRQLTKVA
ncbi:MAG: WbuC family cupin fold metalloprotein [Leeuwenhoekiella sp.]